MRRRQRRQREARGKRRSSSERQAERVQGLVGVRPPIGGKRSHAAHDCFVLEDEAHPLGVAGPGPGHLTDDPLVSAAVNDSRSFDD